MFHCRLQGCLHHTAGVTHLTMLAATRMIAMNMKMAFLICFVEFLFLYPDDSWYAECRDIYDQTKDAM
jgi:hypothetical protein